MYRSSLRIARPLRSISRAVHQNGVDFGVRAPQTPRLTASISTSLPKLRPGFSSAENQRPSERPVEASPPDPRAPSPAKAVDAIPTISRTTTKGSNETVLSTYGSQAAAASIVGEGEGDTIDWSMSFHGLATTPFPPETNAILMRAIDPNSLEIKPDGIIYLPEIKYRRILNEAFGPGGWGLAPRSDTVVGAKSVTREYALIVHGRFIAQARGECAYFAEETIPAAGEGCKSNALMRCCKDLGIASELWDPRFIRQFKTTHCQEVWVEHAMTKKRRQIWLRKGDAPVYPFVLKK